VEANFVISNDVFTVTPPSVASTIGTLSPSTKQSVAYGGVTSFTLTKLTAGYQLTAVAGAGTCPFGSIVGNTYTTGPITSNCAVSLNFVNSGSTYNVNANNGPGGTVSPGSAAVYNNAYYKFTLTPNTGYHVSGVAPTNCVGILSGNTYTAGPINSASLLTVSFAANTYLASTSAGAGGTISPTSNDVNYTANSVFTITPTAASAHIYSVNGCGGSFSGNNLTGGNWTTGSMTSNCAVTATFGYYVTANATTGGSINGSTNVNVSSGSNAAFNFSAATNYEFSSVTGSCPAGSLSGSKYTTGAVTSACLLTANFVPKTSPSVKATAATGGTISPGALNVANGTTASFTVTPKAGYHILNATWGNCPLGSFAGNMFTGGTWTTGAINSSCTVAANFALNSFTVTATAGTGGSVNAPSTATVNSGSTATFKFNVNPGYTLSTVSGCNGTLTGNAYKTGPITSSCLVSAVFAGTTFKVTPSAGTGTGGSISPSTAQYVANGSTISFTITPKTGYNIAPVPTGSGMCPAGNFVGNTYTTGPISSACTVIADFVNSGAQFQVTPKVAFGHGTISPSTVQYVDSGGITSFTLAPGTGYATNSVIATNCSGTLSGNTYTTAPITSECLLQAVFAATSPKVTELAGIGGKINGANAVNQFPSYGESLYITVTNNAGYDISSVTGCNGTLSGQLYTTDPITSACTVTATFSTFNEYHTNLSANSAPSGIAADTNGSLWFTETAGNRIGHINSANGAITEFSAGLTYGAPVSITEGPDGNLWFTESDGAIGRITSTGLISEFAFGLTLNSEPQGITAGPDGNLWFTESDGAIGRISPTAPNGITEYQIPSGGSAPSGITAGPDGNIWFTEAAGAGGVGAIGQMNLTSNVITEFSAGLTPASQPNSITAGSDGNLWFTEAAGAIGQITPAGLINEYAVLTNLSNPSGITAGPDGNIWFTEAAVAGSKIGRITVNATPVITEFQVTASSAPTGIAAGPDGNIWFTENAHSKIGQLVLEPIAGTYSVSGTITYASFGGLAQGPVYVGLFSAEPSSFSQALYSTIADSAGSYTITSVPNGSYELIAIQTQNINGPSFTDPYGVIAVDVSSSSLTNQNVSLTSGSFGVSNPLSNGNGTLTVWQGGSGSGTMTVTTGSGSLSLDSGTETWTGTFPPFNTVKLTESPTFSSSFGGWSGCDTSASTTCTVTMSGARNVKATFLAP
jgi:streptogramin lyase